MKLGTQYCKRMNQLQGCCQCSPWVRSISVS